MVAPCLPLLENPQAEWPDRQLFVHKGAGKRATIPNAASSRVVPSGSQRWRFVNNKELYDISVDPYERPTWPPIIRTSSPQLRKAYDAWWTEDRAADGQRRCTLRTTAAAGGPLRETVARTRDPGLESAGVLSR